MPDHHRHKPLVRGLIRSFQWAFAGLAYQFRVERNAWIQLGAAVAVLVCGFALQVDRYDWCLLVLAIGLVMTAETFNTALELLVDAVIPEQSESARRVKDVSAGAVVLAAMAAAAVGLLVFLPRLLEILGQ